MKTQKGITTERPPHNGEPVVCQLSVSGMHCASCVGRVERALSKVPGVVSAAVNLAAEQARVEVLPDQFDAEALKQAVVQAGYQPGEPQTEFAFGKPGKAAAEAEAERTILRRKLSLAVGSAIILMALMAISHAGAGLPAQTIGVLSLIIATPVQFWSGAMFYIGAWQNLKRGSADMNTLIAVGTSAAYFYSVAAVIYPPLAHIAGLHFDTAATIIALILLGRYLEAVAKGRASAAISRLLDLRPATTTAIRDGKEIAIPIDDVMLGDILLVRPGEKVPVDGVVIEGTSSVNEALVTGESLPVDKGLGDEVIGGSINQAGAFKMKATRIGANTVLARVIRLVEEAQLSKAPVQRLVDKVAGIFVPIVLLIAGIVFLVWMTYGPAPAFRLALVSSIAVLIISCPCALGLATPMAILVGAGKGAESGVFFRSAEALETVGQLHTIIFDKTGTLTLGQPTVTDVTPVDQPTNEAPEQDLSDTDVLRLAAAVEAPSEHPLGKAIVDAAREKGLELPAATEFRALVGHGVTAQVDNQEILIGAPRLFVERNIPIDHLEEHITRLSEEGKTASLVATNGAVIGIIALSDPPKPEAAEVVKQLKRLGLETALITGDNWKTAHAVARQVGIDTVQAEVLPEEKANAVKKLQAQAKKVAMVGDGINDAPALAQADLGIALGSGTDVAVEVAAVTLIGDNLRSVVAAIRLGRRTFATIRQNLFWAFFYNIIAIPIAAGALYPSFGITLHPIIAAAAMAFSSLSVVLNSLRLKNFSG